MSRTMFVVRLAFSLFASSGVAPPASPYPSRTALSVTGPRTGMPTISRAVEAPAVSVRVVALHEVANALSRDELPDLHDAPPISRWFPKADCLLGPTLHPHVSEASACDKASGSTRFALRLSQGLVDSRDACSSLLRRPWLLRCPTSHLHTSHACCLLSRARDRCGYRRHAPPRLSI